MMNNSENIKETLNDRNENNLNLKKYHSDWETGNRCSAVGAKTHKSFGYVFDYKVCKENTNVIDYKRRNLFSTTYYVSNANDLQSEHIGLNGKDIHTTSMPEVSCSENLGKGCPELSSYTEGTTSVEELSQMNSKMIREPEPLSRSTDTLTLSPINDSKNGKGTDQQTPTRHQMLWHSCECLQFFLSNEIPIVNKISRKRKIQALYLEVDLNRYKLDKPITCHSEFPSLYPQLSSKTCKSLIDDVEIDNVTDLKRNLSITSIVNHEKRKKHAINAQQENTKMFNWNFINESTYEKQRNKENKLNDHKPTIRIGLSKKQKVKPLHPCLHERMCE